MRHAPNSTNRWSRGSGSSIQGTNDAQKSARGLPRPPRKAVRIRSPVGQHCFIDVRRLLGRPFRAMGDSLKVKRAFVKQQAT